MENMNDKTSILEQAIVDAKLLRESALKAAENEVLNKYATEIKESVFRFLEQEEEDVFADPPNLGLGGMEDPENMPIDPVADAVPLAATDGERMCACPDEDEEVEIDFGNIETDMAQDAASPEMSLPPPEEDPTKLQEMEQDHRVQLPEEFSGRLVPFAEVLGKESAMGQTLEMVLEGSAVPRDLLEMCLKELQDLAFQGYDDASLSEMANELREYFGPSEEMEEQSLSGDGEVPSNDILSQIANLDKELEEVSVEEDEDVDFMLMDALIADLENTPTGKLGGGLNDREVQNANDIASVIDASDDVLGGNPLVAPKRMDVPSTPAKPSKVGGSVPSSVKYDDDNVKMMKRLREMEEQVNSLRTELSRLETTNNGLQGVVQESRRKLESMSLKNVKLAYMYETVASGASLNERRKRELVEAIQQSDSISEIKSIFERGMSSTADVDEFRSLIKENRFSVLKAKTNLSQSEQYPDEIQRLREMAGIKK